MTPRTVPTFVIIALCLPIAASILSWQHGKQRGVLIERDKWHSIKSDKTDTRLAEVEREIALIKEQVEINTQSVQGLIAGIDKISTDTEEVTRLLQDLNGLLAEAKSTRAKGYRIVNEIDARRASL